MKSGAEPASRNRGLEITRIEEADVVGHAADVKLIERIRHAVDGLARVSPWVISLAIIGS